ncbi:DUF58 domain-containing protein [Haloplanus litoreus]|uniref:DUF58 domain-containing protein n=1 Tax=Haloplanus litoreus TaxID=767515 RepID=A0ABD5ZVP6_9EURY
MRGRRRFWATVASAGILVTLGVAATNPVFLAGGVGLGLWLLVHQVEFLRRARRVADGGVEVTTVRDRIAVGDAVVVHLRASLDVSPPFDLTVTPNLPPSVERPEPEPTLSLAARTRTGETAFEATSRVVGELIVGPAVVGLRDTGGFFAGAVRGGDSSRVDVRPRTPRNLHVGEGGQPLTSRYGEHNAGVTGAGLEPYEIREYSPGDQLSRIDWKATARLHHPHIREFERTTTHETALVVDARTTMGVGSEGETKLDYLRTVALSVVNTAASFDDPLGLYVVGDDGPTTARDPAAGIDQYDSIRGHLRGLDATDRAAGTDAGAATEPLAPSRARTVASRLDEAGTRLGATLGPYFEATPEYVGRLRDRPLFRAVQLAHARLRSGSWTILLTDGTNRTEVHEAVKLARRNDGHVLLFLAPSVLYEPGALAEPDRAAERYRAFEEFRQSLARLDRVSAFEVGPGDRLEAILDRHDTAARRGRDADAARAARASRRYRESGETPRRGLAYAEDDPIHRETEDRPDD